MCCVFDKSSIECLTHVLLRILRISLLLPIITTACLLLLLPIMKYCVFDTCVIAYSKCVVAYYLLLLLPIITTACLSLL